SAADKATGRSQHITITASSGLAKDEVKRMVKDAEAHAAEDKQRREEVEARNAADGAIFTAEKALREGGDKVPAEVKTSVEEKIAALKAAMDAKDNDGMKRATEALYQAIQSIGASMYQGG